ncbi:Uncharacterized protein Adt_22854 [Abeliophyllum distichum]|uniref:Uncharacterized protein n=1 Tax=Abeliophyllum distichum TaxID=126358 RepID=A0ABD1SCQ2_9LAMI
MASREEDFSFPATDSPSQFVDSPPLWWRTSSEASCSENPKKIGENSGNILEEKFNFFSSKNTSHNPRTNYFSADDKANEEEEKMDMLWEDLNEEFSSKTLKLLKAKKKPSILVFLKVLKRVFVMHNSRHHSIKKRAW